MVWISGRLVQVDAACDVIQSEVQWQAWLERQERRYQEDHSMSDFL